MTEPIHALESCLPILPDGAEILGPELAVLDDGERYVFWNAAGPVYTCRKDDEQGIRQAIAMFASLGVAMLLALAAHFGVHRNTAARYKKLYDEQGVAGLEHAKRGPKGPHKLKGIAQARAQKYLNQGKSNTEVARLEGVSEGCIREALRMGRLHRPDEEEEQHPQENGEPLELPSSRQRSEEDQACAGGVGTRREEDRLLAYTGKMVEAEPRFEPAEGVEKAGVLLAVPALVDQGLLAVGQNVFGALKNGFYGLSSVLLTFAMMALLRISNPEQLPTFSPGEFGRLLGLDRVTEMKTLRRKLKELASHFLAWVFIDGLARLWVRSDPKAVGYLYVDGHVRAYNGDKHKLPKKRVARRRMSMPATTEYWVNDADARPVFFVVAPANEGLLKIMDLEILPEIRELVGPDRRPALVFDREGWSPKRFREWSSDALNFDVLTYRKGSYEDWSEECFFDVDLVLGGNHVTFKLGERSILLIEGTKKKKPFWVREVRRLCDSGKQTSVITTLQVDVPIEEVAVRMFARWTQENFFKYMRQEYDLDHMPTTAVEPADPERLVPNPARKLKLKELATARQELAKVEAEYGQQAFTNPEKKRRTMRGFKVANSKVSDRIHHLKAQVADFEREAEALPTRIPVGDLLAKGKVVRLETERKILIDGIKMAAYRAETQLADLVRPVLAKREDEARKFIREVFALRGDLIPNYDAGRLTVHFHGMATWHSDRALATLCDALNARQVRYPGTQLVMVFEAMRAS